MNNQFECAWCKSYTKWETGTENFCCLECEKGFKIQQNNIQIAKDFTKEYYKIPNAAIAWNFEDAPKQFQELSRHGGDEDLVILISVNSRYPLSEIGGYVCDSQEIILDDMKIIITAHA